MRYTTDDLRAEAARQHRALTRNPYVTGIADRMQGTEISSLTTEDEPGVVQGTTWDDLDPVQFNAAQQDVDKLLDTAADVSTWAVTLGADGLEPEDHKLEVKEGDKTMVRVYFGFAPELTDEDRAEIARGIGDAAALVMGDALSGAGDSAPATGRTDLTSQELARNALAYRDNMDRGCSKLFHAELHTRYPELDGYAVAEQALWTGVKAEWAEPRDDSAEEMMFGGGLVEPEPVRKVRDVYWLRIQQIADSAS